MAKGKIIMKGERRDRKVTVALTLDNMGKVAENSGMLANLSNRVHELLRADFCAHQISVVKYQEPATPARLLKGKYKPVKK